MDGCEGGFTAEVWEDPPEASGRGGLWGEGLGTVVRFPSSLGLFEIVTVLVCEYFNQQVN